jgi:hypothetical protein
VGYRRFEGLMARHELAKLYALTRLFINFFQPSFKLKEKLRDGAKVVKRYHRPATPYQRLLADARISDETRDRLSALYATLDPILLLRNIRQAQERLVAIADKAAGDPMPKAARSRLRRFCRGFVLPGVAARSARSRVRNRRPSASAAALTPSSR